MAPRKIYAGPYEARQCPSGNWQIWHVDLWYMDNGHPERRDQPLSGQKEVERPIDGARTYATYSSAGRRARQLNREWQDAERKSEGRNAEREWQSEQMAEELASM